VTTILIVDDDVPTLRSIERTLKPALSEQIALCNDPQRVLDVLEERTVVTVLLDLMMPDLHGEELLPQILERHPTTSVVVVTGEDDVDTAVRCMKLGALDYLVKPVDPERLLATVRNANDQSALKHQARHLREQFLEPPEEPSEAFRAIITDDPSMKRVFSYLEAVARGSHPVLISGETGTGKELLARAVHDASQRKGSFVAVNVAGLDETAFSDTLFGHRAGAFTGASDARPGLIEEAGHGTLFLDEIGDLEPQSQIKLLRLLQEREYRPLGSDAVRPLHARIVAATHQDTSVLRQDLYYRLRHYHARVPPLRERTGDVPLLVERFLVAAAEDLHKPTPTVARDLFALLSDYEFPGNVRELQAMVFDAVARSNKPQIPTEVFVAANDSLQAIDRPADGTDPLRFPSQLLSLRDLEQAAVEEALRRTKGNQSAAARMLGISRAKIGRLLSGQRADDERD